jgi:intergrase/recombinase
LNTYLNNVGILEHFRFEKTFIRGTRNPFMSILPSALIEEIAKSKPITINELTMRLKRHKLGSRINELRDYYETFMVRYGLIREEVDLLCGRIPASVFIRNYWSPSIGELQSRVLSALAKMGDCKEGN